jgi:hypothetical protein
MVSTRSIAADRWTAVAADRNSSVALKGLALGVVDVQQITTIKEGGGSLHPLPSDAWIQVTAQVKNTSGRPARLRDEQFNLLLGTTRFHDAPEATSSEHDGLTRGTKKLGGGKVRTGTIEFAVPVADAATATAPSSALLFAGFGGDWAFSTFPDDAFGLVRLGR